MLRLFIVCLLGLCGPWSARAAELVMFEEPGCEWCESWDEEVGVVYGKTPEGRRAPLRRLDIYDRRPEDLKRIKPVIYTPTFVLIDQDREIGRITGYPGESFFWEFLKVLIDRLDPLERGTQTRPTPQGN